MLSEHTLVKEPVLLNACQQVIIIISIAVPTVEETTRKLSKPVTKTNKTRQLCTASQLAIYIFILQHNYKPHFPEVLSFGLLDVFCPPLHMCGEGMDFPHVK